MQLKPEYKRDLNHNYMILEPGDEVSAESFQVRMLLANDISGIIPCELRTVDGAARLYYKITSFQSLKTLMEHSAKIERKLPIIYEKLFRIFEELSEFLLPVDELVLQPDYIYVDANADVVKLLYLPGYHRDIYESFRELMEYLLPKVDHSDKEAVALHYGMYKLICDGTETLSEIREFIRQKGVRTKEEAVINAGSPFEAVEALRGCEGVWELDIPEREDTQNEFGSKDKKRSGIKGILTRLPAGIYTEKKKTGKRDMEKRETGKRAAEKGETGRAEARKTEVGRGTAGKSETGKKNTRQKNIEQKQGGTRAANSESSGILARIGSRLREQLGFVVVVVLLIFLLTLKYFRVPGGIYILLLALVFVGAVLAVCGKLIEIRKNKADNTAIKEKSLEEAEQFIGEASMELINEIRNSEKIKAAGAHVMGYHTADGMRHANLSVSDSECEVTECLIQPTTALVDQTPLPYLISDEDQDIRYRLDKELILVGKLGSAVDIEIPSRTVSRIHAKIQKLGEDYHIGDLNSLNGTVIDGRQIEGNQTELLADGAHILFADQGYYFSMSG